VGLSDIFLKGGHLRTIPAKFGLTWFSSSRGKDLNVIFYQNMPNLQNWFETLVAKNSSTEEIVSNIYTCVKMITASMKLLAHLYFFFSDFIFS
jgi:hypothetical protein